jgi:hypothetical protein
VTTDTAEIPEALQLQLDMLELRPGRPLLISDADEVLFAFMASFERYMNGQGAFFDWASYRLNGNIRRKSDSEPLAAPEVRALIGGFFRDETRNIPPVAGAAGTLKHLSGRMQVVVLSNLPHDQYDDRRHALMRHGMDYPLITNQGSKAPAVRALAAHAKGPVVFVDDSPSHHREVAEMTHHVRRIHFVGNERLSALLETSEHSHYRAQTWDDIKRHIERHLTDEGY